jgi:DnaJ-class molecular chaperone
MVCAIIYYPASRSNCYRGPWYNQQRKQGRDQEGLPQSWRPALPLDDLLLTHRQAALAHHPDKVAEDERVEAEVRFKAAKQAYEILNDDDKRHLYDTHGMSAFDPASGMGGGGPDMDDIFAQMFGGMGGFGGMPGMGGMGGMPGGGGRNVPRKGRSVEQEYEVSLEELYKGKTTKFSNTKNVVCSVCKGSGGKQGAKSHSCGVCNGRGMFNLLLTLVIYKLFTNYRCKSSPPPSWSRSGNSRNRTLR